VRFEQDARGLLGIMLLPKHAQYAIVGFRGLRPLPPGIERFTPGSKRARLFADRFRYFFLDLFFRAWAAVLG